MDFFAANIKHLRLHRRLKQHDFVELGFSRTQWNNYEKYVSRPKVDDIVKIANFFGVTETELLHTDLIRKSSGYAGAKESYIVAEPDSPYDSNSLKGELIESLQLNVETLKQLVQFKDNQIQSLRTELALLEDKMKES